MKLLLCIKILLGIAPQAKPVDEKKWDAVHEQIKKTADQYPNPKPAKKDSNEEVK